MKYAFIKAHRKDFSVERMCQVLGVSRSGFYHHSHQKPSIRAFKNKQLMDEIKLIYQENKRCYGSPRIHAELQARGIRCGKHRVARLMKVQGLKAKVRRRVKFNPFIHQEYPVGINRLERCFKAEKPNCIWVSDITYIPTQAGWLYLVVIIDLFSRAVVGYSMSKDMRKEFVLNAFEQAVALRQPPKDLIFHSDRGMQYINDRFQDRLKECHAISSMSRKGNCYDNAVAESFFHTLKTELTHHEHYRTQEEARRSIFEYIAIFYNGKRRHSYLNYLSPRQFEIEFGKA